MFVECPRCGSTHSRPSRSFGLFDSVMRSWARLPYRCRVCRKRFYHLDSALAEQRAEELDRMGDPETVQDNGPVAAPPCRRRSYRVVIRIRLPRLLRPRPAG